MDAQVKPAHDERCESSRDKPGHDAELELRRRGRDGVVYVMRGKARHDSAAYVMPGTRPGSAFNVMAGLVPAIHVFAPHRKEDVDARHKAGHDGEMCASSRA
ncbi:hypothetical protein [uncultured Bradyrhizobium sp.]|uniref:hypothetical protein n=1 Tax=uncultured Bradyrhizobium sp. TaxID=199684 RepID=UPI0035CA5A3D